MNDARPAPTDVVLLASEWRPRALMMMRRNLRPGSKPRLAIVDLDGLSDPAGVLRDLHVLMKPDRVLVLTALGTLPTQQVESLGFHVIARPTVIQQVVRAARGLVRSASRGPGGHRQGSARTTAGRVITLGEVQSPDPDLHKGAVEPDDPADGQPGNSNAPALDSEGWPIRPVEIAQDRIGANVDDSEVANAGEAAQTSDAPRDELAPLESDPASRKS